MKINSYIAMKDKLNDEYRKAFDFVEHYGGLHFVGEDAMSEKMMDLMDMMLSSQNEGKNVNSIVGNNLEDFCKNFFSDVTVADMLKDIARQIRTYAWVMFIFETMGLLLESGSEGFDLFTFQSDMAGYMFGLAIAWSGIIIANIVGMILAKFGNYSRKIYIAVASVATVVSVGLVIYLISSSIEITAPAFPLAAVSGAYLLIYYAVLLYKRYTATGTFKKPYDAYHMSFGSMIRQEEAKADYAKDKSVVKAFAKGYKKNKARLIKKGQPVKTTAEYFANQEKINRLSQTIGLAIGLLIGISGTFGNIIEGENAFESVPDMLIYVLVIALVVYLIYRFAHSIDRVAAAERRAILAACQKEGVELDEYCDMLLSGKFDDESKS